MKKLNFALIICIVFLFSGCNFMPNREPFGEKTFSESTAAEMYKKLKESLSQTEYDDMNGYSLKVYGTPHDEDDLIDSTIAKTEEYTAMYYQTYHEEYLWYKDCLYEGNYTEGLQYRDMAWDEFGTDNIAAQQWQLAMKLLEQDYTKIKYKYIPLGSTYLLTAEYEDLEFLNEQDIISASLYIYLDDNGSYTDFGLKINKRSETGGYGRSYNVSFFPYENSTSMVLEARIWSLGYELELTDEGIPALKEREKDREKAHRVISSLDFEVLKDKAVYQEDLAVPIIETYKDVFEKM